MLCGAMRTRDHDHPPVEKLTHPRKRQMALHREAEHRSAKRSSAGAPTAGLRSTSVCGNGFRGGAPGRNQAAFLPARGIYDVPRRRPSRVMWTMRLVRLELTFGTSGELLCLVAGPDINRT